MVRYGVYHEKPSVIGAGRGGVESKEPITRPQTARDSSFYLEGTASRDVDTEYHLETGLPVLYTG